MRTDEPKLCRSNKTEYMSFISGGGKDKSLQTDMHWTDEQEHLDITISMMS